MDYLRASWHLTLDNRLTKIINLKHVCENVKNSKELNLRIPNQRYWQGSGESKRWVLQGDGDSKAKEIEDKREIGWKIKRLKISWLIWRIMNYVYIPKFLLNYSHEPVIVNFMSLLLF